METANGCAWIIILSMLAGAVLAFGVVAFTPVEPFPAWVGSTLFILIASMLAGQQSPPKNKS